MAWPFETSGGGDVTGVTPLFRYANYAEAVLWVVIAAMVWARARRRGGIGGLDVLLAAGLVAFGGSDVVEAGTGAWWRPPWLLVWKGACLLAFAAVFVARFRGRRRVR